MLHTGGRKRFTTKEYKASLTRLETLCGYTTQLYPLVNQRHYTILGQDHAYKVMEKLSEADYCITEVYGKKLPLIVHFNCLKYM